jgi:hypothetical protein
VDDVRPDVDHVAGRGVRPAPRAAAELGDRLEDDYPQAFIGERDGTRESGEPGPDDDGIDHLAAVARKRPG